MTVFCPDMSFPYSDFVITQLFLLVTKMSHQLNDNDVDFITYDEFCSYMAHKN